MSDFQSIDLGDIPDIGMHVESAIKDVDDMLGGKAKEADLDSILNELFSDDSNPGDSGDSKLSSPQHKNTKTTWVHLDDKWRVKIMSERFYKVEGKGSLASALGTTHEKLVQKVVKYLNNNEFVFVNVSRLLQSKAKNKRELIKEIRGDSFRFTKDFLPIIVKVLETDVILFGEDYMVTEYTSSVISQQNGVPESNNSKILLVLENEGYFHTVGYKKVSKITTTFQRNNLPNDLIVLVDRNRFLTKHFQEIQTQIKKNKTLNTFMNVLSERLQQKFTAQEKKDVLRVFNLWLQHQNFFTKPN